MIPLIATVAVVAQAATGQGPGVLPAPPPGVSGLAGTAGTATASVSLLVLLALAAWICVKQKGAQWPHIALGVAIGVVGSGTFIIGGLTWAVLGVIVQVITQIGHTFTS
jgi:hypothetical protein